MKRKTFISLKANVPNVLQIQFGMEHIVYVVPDSLISTGYVHLCVEKMKYFKMENAYAIQGLYW